MVSKMKDIEKQALQLSITERAQLIERLMRSLDGEEDPDAERAWIEESKRRHREIQEGKMTGKPADQVFTEARSRP
nr:addiction module protein [Candidatus Sigynarchaeum springense]MDO8116274.1 addiction module protein [Candidatus Sigynarchaeota archaeon]